MSLSKIALAQAIPGDYFSIAKLVETAFEYEEFGIVAFGPKRMTPSGNEKRAKKMAKPPNPGETRHEMKAVITLPNGTEEIIGYASWIICIGRSGSEEEKERLGTREGWAREEKEKEEKRGNKEDEEGHGNAKIRKDVLGGIEKILAKSTEGGNYVLLSMLVVAPTYQRQGVGAMLFEDGLKIADERGLQVIMGASSQGVGLYKKYGCVEIEVLKTNLWEYEGGEGLGVTTHCILHRPGL